MHRYNATFNNISVIARRRSVLLVEETGCCIGYTSTWTGFEITTVLVIGIDCTGSCKSNNYSITVAQIHVYTNSTCRCKFNYIHLTIVDTSCDILDMWYCTLSRETHIWLYDFTWSRPRRPRYMYTLILHVDVNSTTYTSLLWTWVNGCDIQDMWYCT